MRYSAVKSYGFNFQSCFACVNLIRNSNFRLKIILFSHSFSKIWILAKWKCVMVTKTMILNNVTNWRRYICVYRYLSLENKIDTTICIHYKQQINTQFVSPLVFINVVYVVCVLYKCIGCSYSNKTSRGTVISALVYQSDPRRFDSRLQSRSPHAINICELPKQIISQLIIS